jgi:hypothetical protein
MEVGIIAPTEFLKSYCTTDIQYCLPGLAIENKTYSRWFKAKSTEGKKVILDCRKPGWRREPELASIVFKAIKLVDPSVLILPSYMFQMKKTLRVAHEFYEALFNNEAFGFIEQTVGCLEGLDSREIAECLKGLLDISDFYAVPSHLQPKLRDHYKELTEEELIFIENHLKLEELDGLSGILVTSLPIRLGLLGRPLSSPLPTPPSLTFEETKDKYPEITMANVKETIRYYKGD